MCIYIYIYSYFHMYTYMINHVQISICVLKIETFIQLKNPFCAMQRLSSETSRLRSWGSNSSHRKGVFLRPLMIPQISGIQTVKD